MPTVAIKPELLRWAIDRSGLPLEKLCAKFPRLQDWKEGICSPTLRQLEEFARTTMTPFGAMFLDAPPKEELSIPDFRTHNDRPLNRYSPNLLETIQTARQRQAWLCEWLKSEGNDPLDYVGSAETSDNYKSLAQRIRQRLDLDADWAEAFASWEDALQALRKATERIGTVVFSNSVVGLNNSRPLDPDEFRGFVLSDPIAPVVFINDADTKSARIFTLAHELAHVWLGRDGLFNLDKMLAADDTTEQYCNLVAAEFLVPEYKLRSRWKEAQSHSKPFHSIAKWFKVSPVVAARRALQLKLISKTTFFNFYEEDRRAWAVHRAEHRSKATGGNFYATQNSRLGRRFSSEIVRAAREGRILYEEAFQLTGMSGKTFQTYADLVLKRARDERE